MGEDEKALRTQLGMLSAPVGRLKKLKPVHLNVINLHCGGMSNNDIAVQVGRHHTWISIVLNDPLSQAVIKGRMEDCDQEFRGLYGDAVEAIRHSLGAERAPGIRLRAADMYLKAHGKYGGPDVGVESAEDVIQRMLQININVGVGAPTSPQPIEGQTERPALPSGDD